MSSLALVRDINGFNTFGLEFSSKKYNVVLSAAGGEQTLTVPHTGCGNNVWLALFAPQVGSSIWIAKNATAVVPVNTTFAATDSSNNPSPRVVRGGDILHFITADISATVGVELYSM